MAMAVLRNGLVTILLMAHLAMRPVAADLPMAVRRRCRAASRRVDRTFAVGRMSAVEGVLSPKVLFSAGSFQRRVHRRLVGNLAGAA